MPTIRRRLTAIVALIISTGLLVILTNFQSSAENKTFDILTNLPKYNLHENFYSQALNKTTNTQKKYLLPPTLAQWQDKSNSGDYFDQIQPTSVGYLIWSRFPVKVYVETPNNIKPQQADTWVKTVLQAVQEWSAYLPLHVVDREELADITILRKSPPLQGKPPRARSAEAKFELYSIDNNLYHKFKILLAPSQTGQFLLAACRHELGHALGIWGHSQLESDVMYFSQVRTPPLISVRDVNTLKRVYQQETKLGVRS